VTVARRAGGVLRKLPVARKLEQVSQAKRLRELPSVHADTSNLAPAGDGADAIGEAAVPAGDWAAVAQRVAEVGITGSAENVNYGDRRALYYLLRHLAPKRVLEVGTHIGTSTVHLALALAHGGADGRLVTVDIADVNDPATEHWKRFGAPLSPRAALDHLGVADRVEFVRGASLEHLAELPDHERYDLVFLDGDHAAETVYQEVPAALRRLAPGGHVLLHDYFPGGRPLWPDRSVLPGPWLAIERLRSEGVPIVAVPLARLPWPTKQGTDVTSLALVCRAA
jgi:predicted O-methyltransferase YrrM